MNMQSVWSPQILWATEMCNQKHLVHVAYLLRCWICLHFVDRWIIHHQQHIQTAYTDNNHPLYAKSCNTSKHMILDYYFYIPTICCVCVYRSVILCLTYLKCKCYYFGYRWKRRIKFVWCYHQKFLFKVDDFRFSFSFASRWALENEIGNIFHLSNRWWKAKNQHYHKTQ